MRQRGERNYRPDNDQRDYREGSRGYGAHRPGMANDDWDRRGRMQNRPYDEEYDELEDDYAQRYGRDDAGAWDAGGYGEYQGLDEGRIRFGRRRTDSGDQGSARGSFGSERRQRQPDIPSYTPGRYGPERSAGRAAGGGRFGGREREYGQGGMEEGRVGEWGYGADDRPWQRQGQHAGKAPHGYTRSDDRIREDVCDLLTAHPDLDPSNIDIKVEKCVVVLSGTVDSREDKRLAEDIAEGVHGVQDVRNELRVQRQSGELAHQSTAASPGTGSSSQHQQRK